MKNSIFLTLLGLQIAASSAFADDAFPKVNGMLHALLNARTANSLALDYLKNNEAASACLFVGKFEISIDDELELFSMGADDKISNQVDSLDKDALKLAGFCAKFDPFPGLIQKNDFQGAIALSQIVSEKMNSLSTQIAEQRASAAKN